MNPEPEPPPPGSTVQVTLDPTKIKNEFQRSLAAELVGLSGGGPMNVKQARRARELTRKLLRYGVLVTSPAEAPEA